jgi:hypothetical protein
MMIGEGNSSPSYALEPAEPIQPYYNPKAEYHVKYEKL